MNESITINYGLISTEESSKTSSPDSEYYGDWLRLSQKPYEEKSMSDFDQWLIDNEFGYAVETLPQQMEIYKSVCEEITGELKVTIEVHRSRSDLNYTISASYGILSPAIGRTSSINESINVNGEDSKELGLVVSDNTSAEWEGDVVSSDGSFLNPKPEISISDNEAFFGSEVTGTFRLSGRSLYDEYVLTITPRLSGFYDSEKPESAYQSTVVALWGGGVETLVVTMPDMTGNCLEAVWGGDVVIDPDDDDDEEEKCIRLIEVRDPCTGDLISSREEQISCPEETDEGETP